MNKKEIASLIDHTVLAPDAPHAARAAACEFAAANKCAAVCISPFFVAECAQRLAGTDVKVCTVVGFPHGVASTGAKVAEARIAMEDGADELDMVVNAAKIKDQDWDYVKRDIAAVTAAVHGAGRKIKVIFENCLLDDCEKIRLCEICSELRCDWVKTSTGYGSGGATLEDVALMKAHIAPEVQIKAAGGIRTLEQVLAFHAAGATRIGCSRTAAVLADKQ
jgi:deoxyribose-phosphate aldolase